MAAAAAALARGARQGEAAVVDVRAPEGVRLALELEDGTTRPLEVTAPPLEERDGRRHVVVDLPDLPLGWHRLTATTGDESDEAVLVVAPVAVGLPPGLDRTWGWMVQLYALRSRAPGASATTRTCAPCSRRPATPAAAWCCSTRCTPRRP